MFLPLQSLSPSEQGMSTLGPLSSESPALRHSMGMEALCSAGSLGWGKADPVAFGSPLKKATGAGC